MTAANIVLSRPTISTPSIKMGEYCVHLAGIFGLVLMGFAPGKRWWSFLILFGTMLGISSRGSLLAFAVAFLFLILIRPRIQILVPLIACCALIAISLAAFDIHLEIPSSSRELSLTQLSDNFKSLVGHSELQSLEGTKNWRLTWWNKIWDYTFKGPFFWTGKGYGINLADSDGFQVGTRDEPLRSPHSSHMTYLARAGVPGFALWIALQIVWAGSMMACHVHARKRGFEAWASLFAG